MQFGLCKAFLNHNYHSKLRGLTARISHVLQTRDFHVTTTGKQVVKAALPLQDHWLPLSNLDLLVPPLDISLFYCYKKPLNITNTTVYETIKTALAESLVSYYPFAGEVVKNPIGEPEILCNNSGVDFVEADADVELSQLNLHDPDDSIAKLVPIKKHGVIAVQVTQLKCGSVVVGCTFDHRVADGYSMHMFLSSWTEIARLQVPVSIVPSFRRSLLNPRRPLIIDSSIDQMYMPVTSILPSQETTNPEDLLATRIYYIKADALEELQTQASRLKNCKRTKLESFSGFLWKLMAKHTTKDPFPRKTSKFGIIVDGRKRFMKQENNTYFGNVLSLPFGEQRIDELINKPLSWVAEEVHKFLDKSVTKEHFLNLIDWVETHRPTPMVSRIYDIGLDDGPAFVVSFVRSFPMRQVDFGWGSPVFGSYYTLSGGSSGFVFLMPSTLDNGDWLVYLHLTKGQLKFIEDEASHVLRPIDNNYLKI